MQGFGDYIKSDVVSSCRARDYKDATDLICSSTGEGQNDTTTAKPNARYIVRRLTPLECTRLQGLPDGWLDIGDWYDDNGKLHKESDSVKYKALGNSIAIPPWLFVLGSLNEYCEDKTMASLFDGISCFPLIWSFLNGKENCVWSSEVDSFCRAVARIRFPDTSDDAKTRSKN
jgi:DNA (cytosine-5)-methyltransferase 1